MSSSSKPSEFQATAAVNNLIKSILPGAQKISANGNSKKKFRQRGSTAQLIDRNLKRRVELNKENVFLARKKERKARKHENKLKRLQNEKLDQQARIHLLIKHESEGTLSVKEKSYMNKLLKRNESNAKAWDLDDDDEDELRELQKYILGKSMGSHTLSRSSKRRKRVKEFKEEIEETNSASLERKYPGLTPGLAPVGLSDEESSDDDE